MSIDSNLAADALKEVQVTGFILDGTTWSTGQPCMLFDKTVTNTLKFDNVTIKNSNMNSEFVKIGNKMGSIEITNFVMKENLGLSGA